MRGTRGSRTALLAALLLAACAGDEELARKAGRLEFERARRHYEQQFAGLAPLQQPGSPSPAPTPPPAPSPTGTPAVTAGATPVPIPAATDVLAFAAPAGPEIASPPPGTMSPPAGRVATPAPSANPATAAIRPSGTPAPRPTRTPPARVTPAPRTSGGISEMGLTPPVPGDRIGESLGTPAATPTSARNDEPTGSDAEPPRLASIAFIPPQTPDGADVRITVIATDNLSGAISGSGSLISPSGKIFIPFAVAIDPASDALAGVLKVPSEAESGVWRLSSIRLTDRAQNSVVLTPREDPVARSAALTVASSRSDNELPVLESIELSPSQIEDGGSVKVIVRAHDDRSGMSTVRGILANPARTVQLNFYPRLEPSSGAFEGTVALPKHSEYGDWSVTLVTLTDVAGNRATLTVEDERLRAARLRVVSSSSDTTPPQLVSISLSPPRIQQASPLLIQVVASDDLSGVRGVDGWVLSPNTNGKIPFSLRASERAGEFSGRVETNKCTALGTWRVDRLALSDGSGNRVVLTAADSPINGATFDIDPGPEACTTPTPPGR